MSDGLWIDTRGLKCPMPLLKLKQGLKQLKAGQELQVVVDDPRSALDFFKIIQEQVYLIRMISVQDQDSHLEYLTKTALISILQAGSVEVRAYTFYIEKLPCEEPCSISAD